MMNPEMFLQVQNQLDYNANQENTEPVYNIGKTTNKTRTERKS